MNTISTTFFDPGIDNEVPYLIYITPSIYFKGFKTELEHETIS